MSPAPEHETGDQPKIPSELPVLPLRDMVVFPFIIAPLSVARDISMQAVDRALSENRMILLAAQRDKDEEDPGEADLFPQSIEDSLLGTLDPSDFDEDMTNDNILQAGETWTLVTPRIVQEGDDDPLTNTVTVDFDTQADFTGAEATDEDSFTVELFQPSIDVEKEASVDSAAVGDTVTYTITITNTSSTDTPDLINPVIEDSTITLTEAATV